MTLTQLDATAGIRLGSKPPKSESTALASVVDKDSMRPSGHTSARPNPNAALQKSLRGVMRVSEESLMQGLNLTQFAASEQPRIDRTDGTVSEAKEEEEKEEGRHGTQTESTRGDTSQTLMTKRQRK